MPVAEMVVISAAVFFLGVILGVIIIVSVAIRREEAYFTLYGAPSGVLARGARRVTGFYLWNRQDWLTSSLRWSQDTTRRDSTM